MSPIEVERSLSTDARARGPHAFIERRVLGVGVRLGAVLAAWNAAVGGTFGDYDRHRLVLEGAFYLLGSMACSALSAVVEWRSTART
jgi:hypothetical protein